MRTKTLTVDCVKCKLCSIDNDSNTICSWGKGESKIMKPAKGKKKIKCKLIGDHNAIYQTRKKKNNGQSC